jgi:Ca2+-binding EF-hand superfamily protein
MSSFKDKVFSEINKFRTNPKSIEQRVQTFRLGLSRLRGRDPFLLEIDAFISSLNDLKPMPPFQLNELLSKAAEKQVEIFSRDEDSYNSYISGETLRGIIPDQYVSQNCALMANSADEPETIINQILLNKMDKFKIGRIFLTNPRYRQVGIAHLEKDDENYVVVILAQTEAKKRKAIPLPDGDLTELKNAFDLFDFEKQGEICPRDIVETMENLGYDKKNPELYDIMVELDVPENESVDFSLFANHVVNSCKDKETEDGLRIIFELFVDDHTNDTMSSLYLKRIIQELDEKDDLKTINGLMSEKGGVNAKLSFPEFVDYMKNHYNEEEINQKIQNVKKYKNIQLSPSVSSSMSGGRKKWRKK